MRIHQIREAYMGILITFLLGIFIVIGALVVCRARSNKFIEQMSVAIAFGTMTALVFTELIPETLASFSGKGRYTLIVFSLLGILVLKFIDKFIPEHDHAHGFSHECTTENVNHIGIMSAFAVIIHNIIEGMTVYSVIEDSMELGLLMALGIGLHNIPMGMMIYSTLENEKKNHRIILLSAVAMSTFVGGLIMNLMWFVINDSVIGILLSIALGMIVYIVVFELAPHLMHSKNKRISFIGILIGIAIIVVGVFLE